MIFWISWFVGFMLLNFGRRFAPARVVALPNGRYAVRVWWVVPYYLSAGEDYWWQTYEYAMVYATFPTAFEAFRRLSAWRAVHRKPWRYGRVIR